MQADTERFSRAGGTCIDAYSQRVLSSDWLGITDLSGLERVIPCPDGYRAIRQRKIELEPLLGRLNQTGENSYLGWLGKLETHTLKIAAVIHVFDYLGHGEKVPGVISLGTVQLAMELVANIGAHMRWVIQSAGEAGESAEAQTIIETVTEGRSMFKRAEVVNKARRRAPFRTMGSRAYGAAAEAFDELVKRDVLTISPSGYVAVG